MVGLDAGGIFGSAWSTWVVLTLIEVIDLVALFWGLNPDLQGLWSWRVAGYLHLQSPCLHEVCEGVGILVGCLASEDLVGDEQCVVPMFVDVPCDFGHVVSAGDILNGGLIRVPRWYHGNSSMAVSRCLQITLR